MAAPGAKGPCGGLVGWAGLGKGKRRVDVPPRSRAQEGLQPGRGSEVLGTRGVRLCLSRERSRPPSRGLGPAEVPCPSPTCAPGDPRTRFPAPLGDHEGEHGTVAGDAPAGTLSWWGTSRGPGTTAEADVRCAGAGWGVRTRNDVLLKSPSSQRRSLGGDGESSARVWVELMGWRVALRKEGSGAWLLC